MTTRRLDAAVEIENYVYRPVGNEYVMEGWGDREELDRTSLPETYYPHLYSRDNFMAKFRPGRCPEIHEILKVVLKCPESYSMS